jgi:signal transduction histidine kinase
MKRLLLLAFWAFLAKSLLAWGQAAPCLAEVEKLAQAAIANNKEGLESTKEYYYANRQTLPKPCVVQLEYTLGFLELQNLRVDSADRHMSNFLSHSLQTQNDSIVVEGYVWYASYKRISNKPTETRQWLDSAWAYLQRRNIRDKFLLQRYYRTNGDYFNIVAHDLTNAEKNYRLALKYTDEKVESAQLTLNNMGYMFMNQGYLEKAAHYFYRSLLEARKSRRPAQETEFENHNTYLNLGFCYRMLGRYTEAEQYAQKAFAIARRTEANDFFLKSSRHLAAAKTELGKHAEALKILKDAEKICLRLKKKDEMAYTYRYLGELYALHLNNPTEGKWYLDKSKQLIEEAGDTEMYHLHNYSLGKFYLQQKNYAEAVQLLTLSLQQGRQVRDRVYEPEILELLYKTYEQQGNPRQAFNYYTQYIGLRDSIVSDAAQLKIKELEAKFNEKSNQLKINKLQATNTLQQAQIDRNRWLISLLVGIGLLLFIVSFLIYETMNNKKKIAQQNEEIYAQRLKELEQQRQLEVYTAVVEGQETERARLARDLHDGLGGMLAGTKIYLSQINESGINGQAVYLQTAVTQIDNSIQELRRIARNMMPETLRKFGLKTALKDLCGSLAHGNLQIQFQSIGLSADIQPPVQLTIYRIVQELITNAIKHAEATEVLVQCLQSGNTVHITVEDNGKGFDVTTVQGNGVGLANVRNRVEYLRGKLDIVSESKIGTTVTVEIHV